MQPRGFFRPKTKPAREAAAVPTSAPAAHQPRSDLAVAGNGAQGLQQLQSPAKPQSALANRMVRHRVHREVNGAALAAEVRKPATAVAPAPMRPEAQPYVPQSLAAAMPSSQPPQAVAIPQVRTAPPPAPPMARPPLAPQPNGNGRASPPQAQPQANANTSVRSVAEVFARAAPPPQPAPTAPPSLNGGTTPPALPRTPPPVRAAPQVPDYSSLPPGVAASLARLAGVRPPGEAQQSAAEPASTEIAALPAETAGS